ncbi:MAG: hypothetical protein KJO31_16040 [Gammaproteobacteria bacterium]|nr:hypothetical protein [Gammaproteobacteria bacterium]
MLKALKTKARNALRLAAAFAPWIFSMYLLYWLEYGGIWTTETPHRGKTLVAILLCGMTLSFLIYSFFAKQTTKR